MRLDNHALFYHTMPCFLKPHCYKVRWQVHLLDAFDPQHYVMYHFAAWWTERGWRESCTRLPQAGTVQT